MKTTISFTKMYSSSSDALNMIPDTVGYDLSFLHIRPYAMKILSDLCKGTLFSDSFISKSSWMPSFYIILPNSGTPHTYLETWPLFHLSSFYISLNPPTWVELLCTYTIVITEFNPTVQPLISSPWMVYFVVSFYTANWRYTIGFSDESTARDGSQQGRALAYSSFMLQTLIFYAAAPLRGSSRSPETALNKYRL